MRLTIDGSNISNGGALTHLVQILRAASPREFGFQQVTVWACAATLAALPERDWLIRRTEPVLERNYVRRAWWQRTRLGELAREDRADLLFVPGGSFATRFGPVVTMSRNMLPFELDQLARFGLSRQTLRLLLLRLAQTRSLRSADGVIFLTEYARRRVQKTTGPLSGEVCVIPHGIDPAFLGPPRPGLASESYDASRPFRLLYVSIVDAYKNHPQLVKAVARLRAEGLPLALDLIGPAYPPSLRALQRTLSRVAPGDAAIRYLGPVAHALLAEAYRDADAVVFASSCENMPNILLEGMASGLPVACSSRGPMPEVLGDGGAYFDPQDPASVARALRELFESSDLRGRVSRESRARAEQYSWTRCADETFTFLAHVAATKR